MIKKSIRQRSCLICLLALGSLSSAALSGSGGQFDISKYSINSGGMVSSGGGFALTGTIAQSNAGVMASSANFNLSGGFWPGGANDIIFISGFESI